MPVQVVIYQNQIEHLNVKVCFSKSGRTCAEMTQPAGNFKDSKTGLKGKIKITSPDVAAAI